MIQHHLEGRGGTGLPVGEKGKKNPDMSHDLEQNRLEQLLEDRLPSTRSTFRTPALEQESKERWPWVVSFLAEQGCSPNLGIHLRVRPFL